MKSVKRLIKIAIMLTLISFAGQFVYINIILPSSFSGQRERCLENSNKFNDPLEVEIAEKLCFEVYPHFN
jgi:hypothetical protein